MRSILLIGLLVGFVAGQGAAQADPKLVGSWQMVSALKEGKPAPAEEVKGTTMTFTEKTVTVKEATRDPETVDYKADATAKPKTLDIVKGGMTLAAGIYELDGDDLKIAVNRGSTTRPTDFKGADKDSAVMVLKRKK